MLRLSLRDVSRSGVLVNGFAQFLRDHPLNVVPDFVVVCIRGAVADPAPFLVTPFPEEFVN